MNEWRLHPAEIQRLLHEAEQAFAQGKMAAAESACRKVLATAPDNPLATHYLGAVAFATGQPEPGLRFLKRATELDPGVAAYHGTLAQALAQVAAYNDALAAVRTAVRIQPGKVEYQYHLGALAGKLGHVDESIAALTKAHELLPEFAGAVNDLGITLASARRVDEGLECFRKAMKLDANYRTAHDNLIYFSHFASGANGRGIDGMTIRADAERWGAKFTDPLRAQIRKHENDRSPHRKLRVGYVSPDLYEHPVGRFMQPILANHDRSAFEVFCYSDAVGPDSTSLVLKGACENWLDTADLNDHALATRIREDRIDILVDLSLHMGRNRLMVFAQKPAPVQVTYLGYAGTSGMRAMDWRITDVYLDPPGNEKFYTEKTYRLPNSYWCYSRPAFADQLGGMQPRDPAAPIAFACLNNVMKISDAALEAWANILREVPGSTILIQGEPGAHLDVMRGFFERGGVDPSRVDFAAKRSLLDYFELYHHIDIALDAFPYAGGTTTCDALWMGVPVVSLAGEIAVHRGAVSILTNLYLAELLTTSPQEYVKIAVELARDKERLSSLRGELRLRMEESNIMNPLIFTRDFEDALRQIWKSSISR